MQDSYIWESLSMHHLQKSSLRILVDEGKKTVLLLDIHISLCCSHKKINLLHYTCSPDNLFCSVCTAFLRSQLYRKKPDVTEKYQKIKMDILNISCIFNKIETV